MGALCFCESDDVGGCEGIASWEVDPEFGAGFFEVAAAGAAVVGVGEGLHEAEAETHAGGVGAGGGTAHVALPDFGLIGGGEAGAGIADGDACLLALDVEPEGDDAAARGVGEGVVEEVGDGLIDALAVEQYPAGVGGCEGEVEAAFICRGFVEVEQAGEQLPEVDDFEMELQGFVLGCAGGENGLHEFGGAVEPFKAASGGVAGGGVVDVIVEGFQIAPDARERGAQLMGEVVIGALQLCGEGVDAVEAGVEGGGEGPEFGDGSGSLKPGLGAALGELAGTEHHLLNGPQHVTHEPPERQQHEDGGGESGEPEMATDVLDVGEVFGVGAAEPEGIFIVQNLTAIL